jgi:hypothetical protein
MRFFVPLVACVGIALTAAGCDPTDRHYFTQGVGTNVYSYDVAAETQLQDTYVEQICHQAGLAPDSCNVDNFSPMVWRLFVLAGMNDIDQRCDAYLTWLDNVRRAQAPTVKQIADTQTATTLVMQAAGVGVGPIAVAAAVFGFATNTFNNVTSRLILEVDHSTVQAVVLSHQKDYRDGLFGTDNTTPVVIASKPAAIYALRSYLRLCMPMTIETQINNIMANFSRGGTDALTAGEHMITPRTVGVAAITNVNIPVTRNPRHGVITQANIGTDDARKILTQYVYPNGVLKPRDKEHEQDVADFMKEKNIKGHVGFFLDSGNFAAERSELLSRLKAARKIL